jgi:hypothetical protein
MPSSDVGTAVAVNRDTESTAAEDDAPADGVVEAADGVREGTVGDALQPLTHDEPRRIAPTVRSKRIGWSFRLTTSMFLPDSTNMYPPRN